MRAKFPGGVFILLMAAAAVPAGAKEKQTVQLQVGERSLSWTIPDGYCAPTGELAGIAQVTAAADTENVTLSTLYKCNNDNQQGHIIVKTPKSTLLQSVERNDLIESVGKEFDNPAFSELLKSDKFDQKVRDGLTSVFGTDLQAQSGIKPIGRDDVCAYLGGSLQMTLGDSTTRQEVVGCITAVKSKVVVLYTYGKDGETATLPSLARQTRDMAARMIAENE